MKKQYTFLNDGPYLKVKLPIEQISYMELVHDNTNDVYQLVLHTEKGGASFGKKLTKEQTKTIIEAIMSISKLKLEEEIESDTLSFVRESGDVSNPEITKVPFSEDYWETVKEHWDRSGIIADKNKDAKYIFRGRIENKLMKTIAVTVGKSKRTVDRFSIQIDDQELVEVPFYIFEKAINGAEAIFEYDKRSKTLTKCHTEIRKQLSVKAPQKFTREITDDERKWVAKQQANSKYEFAIGSFIFQFLIWGILIGIFVGKIVNNYSLGVSICSLGLIGSEVYRYQRFKSDKEKKQIPILSGKVEVIQFTLLDHYVYKAEKEMLFLHVIGVDSKYHYQWNHQQRSDIENYKPGDYIEVVRNMTTQQVIRIRKV